MSREVKKQMIIVGANCPAGQQAAAYFATMFDCLLLDFDFNKLKLVQKKYAPNSEILKFDITSTVDLVGLITYLRARNHFDYVLNFLSLPTDVTNIPLIYKVNLIGTKQLLNYLYPLILPFGAIINISDLGAHLAPIPANVFPLLDDPLAKTFLQEITLLTPTPQEAYLYASCGLCSVVSRDKEKWGLKKAHTLTLFHNVDLSCEEGMNTVKLWEILATLLLDQSVNAQTLNYDCHTKKITPLILP